LKGSLAKKAARLSYAFFYLANKAKSASRRL
jgi:hypothetical protein